MYLNILFLLLVNNQERRTRVAKLRMVVDTKVCCSGTADSLYACYNEIHTKTSIFSYHIPLFQTRCLSFQESSSVILDIRQHKPIRS